MTEVRASQSRMLIDTNDDALPFSLRNSVVVGRKGL